MVEQRTCNAQVVGSIPTVGSSLISQSSNQPETEEESSVFSFGKMRMPNFPIVTQNGQPIVPEKFRKYNRLINSTKSLNKVEMSAPFRR
jgi:hypothetical protein